MLNKVLLVVSVFSLMTVFSGCARQVSPQDVSAKTVSANADVKSLKMEISTILNIASKGGSSPGSLTVSENTTCFLDLINRQLFSSTDFGGTSDSNNQTIKAALNMFTVGGWAYLNGMEAPPGDVWLKARLTDSLWGSQNRDYQAVNFLKGATDVTVSNGAGADKEKTYILNITPSMDSVSKWLLYEFQAVGFGLTSFNLPDSLKNILVRESVSRDTYLPEALSVTVLLELYPGDIPVLGTDFSQFTIYITSSVRFYDYGVPADIPLPSDAAQAVEVPYGSLGLSEYVTYTPPASTSANITKPSLQWNNPPPMTIDVNKQYSATIKTNIGDVVIQLLAREAPMTANNFIFLARQGFYDGVPFHRVVKGFVIQSGDPTGTGMGSPGYSFNDEPVTRDYKAGTLAMANSGPNTNGSQFFITLVDLDPSFPKSYTIFGIVTSGMDVVNAIGDIPVKASSTGEVSSPMVDVHIDTIVIDQK